MLPIYCIRILINTFIEFASSAQINAELRFSPLTPYQTADSLPPPVYGFFENRSDIDPKLTATKSLQIPKSTENWRNYDIKKKKRDEIPRLSSKKCLSFASSEDAQSKNWEIPPDAKLIGYNVQMIAGYIPIIYFDDDDKGRLESGNPAITPDTYSKYLPGYNTTMKRRIDKNYDDNQQSNEMNTVTARINWLENNTDNVLLKDEPNVHKNFSQWENRFFEKGKDSVDSSSTTIGIVDYDDFLWPITEIEPKAEKQKEQSIAINETDHSIIGNNNVTISISPTNHNLLMLEKNARITTRVKPGFRDTKNQLETEISNDLIPGMQSIIAINSSESIPRITSIYDTDGSTHFVFMGRNVEKTQLATSEDKNSPVKKSKYNDGMLGHSILIPEVRDGIRKTEQISFLRHFNSTKLQMIQRTTPISKRLPKIEMSQISSKISKLSVIVPETTVNSTLVQQNNIDKNRSTTDIILMIKPYKREEGVKDMKGPLDIQVFSPANLQNSTMSNAGIMTQTTVVTADSSEFDDEKYEKVKQNEKSADNFDYFSITPIKFKLDNPMKFSKTQLTNEQKHEMNTKLDFDPRNISDHEAYEKLFQGIKSFENERNDTDDLSKEKLIDENNAVKNLNNEGINSKSKENFRNDYNGKDNDDIVYDDNNDNDDNSEDNLKMIKKNDEGISQSEANSKEKQERVNGLIFSPEQIPSFEEWLSSLPIQSFPFPNVKTGIENNQPSTGHFYVPFMRPIKGNRREGIKDEKSDDQEEQHFDINPKKKQKSQTHDYDNSKEYEKAHFQEQQFSLPRNVPYE